MNTPLRNLLTAGALAAAGILTQFATVQAQVANNRLHRIGHFELRPNGAHLELLGQAPAEFSQQFDIYPVEASDDLFAWKPLAIVTRTNSIRTAPVLIDPAAGQMPARFYRVPTNTLPTAYPLPSGPFRTGTRSWAITDPVRTNHYAVARNRLMMVTAWYPAEPRAGVLPVRALEPGVGATWLGLLEASHGYSQPDVPVAESAAGWPVVVYIHGNQGNRRENLQLVEELASHGCVVIAADLDHTSAVRLSSTRIEYPAVLPPTVEHTRIGLADLRLLLEEVAALQAAPGPFGGRLDLTRIATLGWSRGGRLALLLATGEARVRCALMLDAGLDAATLSLVLADGIHKPVMFMQSAVDQNQEQLFKQATSAAYTFVLAGTDHLSYCIEPMLSKPMPATRHLASVIIRISLAFMNYHLKDEPAPELDKLSEAFPEVRHLQMKHTPAP